MLTPQVERRRQLVPRADIVARLWGDGVFVDVEMGVNTAARKVRQALHDSSDAPAFVETVPGKGYRFIADVVVVPAPSEGAPARVRLAVLPFDNLGHDPEREYLADGLTEEAIALLGQIDPEHVAVLGRTSVMAYKRTTKALAEIGRELDASHLVESSIRAEGARLRITSKLIQVRDWDVPAAEASLQRAAALDPGYDFAHRMLGVIRAHAGRHAEAEPALRRARELDPMNPMNPALSSHAAFLAGDYAEAVRFARQAIVVDPGFWIGHFLLAQSAERRDETDLTLEELATAARLSGGNSKAIALRGYLLARLGRKEEAREVLGALGEVARLRYLPPCAMALVHAGLGEADAAFDWLERAYDARDVHLVYLPADPKWDALRADARFPALLKRCGLVGPSVRAR